MRIESGVLRARPPLNAEDPVPLLRNPDSLRIVVVGGPGVFMALAYGASPWVTKPVTLPTGWESLVRRYGKLVPNHAQY